MIFGESEEGSGEDGPEINSGELLFRRIVETIGEVCEETGDLTKFQIIGALECVKLSMIEGILPDKEPETGIDLDGKPEDN